MNTEKTMNTRISSMEIRDISGVRRHIGVQSTLAFRQTQNRPMNEDCIRGIRTDAEIRGSGKWVIA